MESKWNVLVPKVLNCCKSMSSVLSSTFISVYKRVPQRFGSPVHQTKVCENKNYEDKKFL